MNSTPREVGPDFVGVGSQKCGTTWLAAVLAQHPEILFSKSKEIGFFSTEFHRGYKWYNSHFAEKNGRIAGEISVNYAYTPRPDPSRKQFYPKRNYRNELLFWRKRPSARDEMLKHYPGLKVFMMLRNPIDRAWSHYWYWRNRKERIGKAKSVVPFAQMFNEDGRWIRLQGEYATLLTYWREAFPDMGVFFYDDLVNDPERFAKDAFRFLEVSEDFIPKVAMRVNKGSYPDMDEADVRLAANYYRPQIERLGKMTGRDLSHWLKSED